MLPRLAFVLLMISGFLLEPQEASAQKSPQAPFSLNPGDTLRYTVDGSTPDRNSPFVAYGNTSLVVVGTTTFTSRLYRPGYLPSTAQSATVVVSGTRYYAYPAGWALVSLPLTLINREKSVVFRLASGNAYGFSSANGYTRADTLRYGAGYLMKFDGPRAVPMSGGTRSLDTVALQTDWNLFGMISSPLLPSSVQQIPPGIVQSPFYAFNPATGGYAAADTLKPGMGYWVRANMPGRLILSSAATSLMKESGSPTLSVNGAESITITDATGAKQTLYISDDIDERQATAFELPPAPPAGIFDARFATSRLLETVEQGKAKEIPIRISSEQYPLSVSWSLKNQALTASLVMGTSEWLLNGDGEVTIPAAVERMSLKVTGQPSLPAEFALFQNFPNPFNPVTTIKYELPKDAYVTLKVFDILGREVATLVNAQQKAGYKSVQWNASTVASGVYFCRMEAGSFTGVKKLLLLR